MAAPFSSCPESACEPISAAAASSDERWRSTWQPVTKIRDVGLAWVYGFRSRLDSFCLRALILKNIWV